MVWTGRYPFLTKDKQVNPVLCEESVLKKVSQGRPMDMDRSSKGRALGFGPCSCPVSK